MIDHKKAVSVPPVPGSWFTLPVPTKVRLFFFERLSADYSDIADVAFVSKNEDVALGYECGWPSNCNELEQ